MVAQTMLAGSRKTESELAGRIASARRDPRSVPASLEDQMKQREELLITVKAGTDAANAFKVRCLVSWSGSPDGSSEILGKGCWPRLLLERPPRRLWHV